MRTTLALSAALLLAGAAWLQPAHAQTAAQGSGAAMAPDQRAPQPPAYGAAAGQPDTLSQQPQGSFRSSCNDVRMQGQTLIAFCQKSDGTWQTTALGPVSQCVGDIQNTNGELSCNETGYGSSSPPNQAQPAPAQPRY